MPAKGFVRPALSILPLLSSLLLGGCPASEVGVAPGQAPPAPDPGGDDGGGSGPVGLPAGTLDDGFGDHGYMHYTIDGTPTSFSSAETFSMFARADGTHGVAYAHQSVTTDPHTFDLYDVSKDGKSVTKKPLGSSEISLDGVALHTSRGVVLGGKIRTPFAQIGPGALFLLDDASKVDAKWAGAGATRVPRDYRCAAKDGSVLAFGPEYRDDQGTGEQDVTAARIDGAGNVDPSFGPKGRRMLDPVDSQELLAMRCDGAGAIYALHASTRSGPVHVHRYRADGRVDTSYGSSGTAEVTAATNTRWAALAVDDAGRAVVVANLNPTTDGPKPTMRMVVSRLDASGKVDASFRTTTETRDFVASTVLLSEDGNTYVLGARYVDSLNINDAVASAAVLRLEPTGEPSTAFGDAGMVTLSKVQFLASSAYRLFGDFGPDRSLSIFHMTYAGVGPSRWPTLPSGLGFSLVRMGR